MYALFLSANRDYELIVKMEVTPLDSFRDTRHPLHFAVSPNECAVIVTIDMNAISPRILSSITSCIGSTQNFRQASTTLADGHQADADP